MDIGVIIAILILAISVSCTSTPEVQEEPPGVLLEDIIFPDEAEEIQIEMLSAVCEVTETTIECYDSI